MTTPAVTPPAAVAAAQAAPTKSRYQELVESLWDHPELGPAVRRLAHEKYPDQVSKPIEAAVEPALKPLTDQIAGLTAALDTLQKEREAEKQQSEETKTALELNAKINAARVKYSLTDKGYDDMIARMKETGNVFDPEAAAAWAAGQQPRAANPATTFGPNSLDLFGSQTATDDFKLLHRDPEAFLDGQLNEFFRDPDKYVRESGIAVPA